MPSPLPRQVRWNRFAHDCSIVVGLPQITVGAAAALRGARPAQRSLALQPADSPSRLMRPSTPEAPAALLPPPPLRLLPGGAIQFPGGSYLPLWSSAFSRRTVIGMFQQLSTTELLSPLNANCFTLTRTGNRGTIATIFWGQKGNSGSSLRPGAASLPSWARR